MHAHATPGGPAVELPITESLTAWKLSLGPMDNNAYLLVPADGDCLLIDAPTEPDAILQLIDGRPLSAIITTHRHRDHIGALAELALATGAETYCGRPDAEAIEEATGVRQTPLWTGDQLFIGDQELDVIGLVGHTPGAIAIVARGNPTHIFSGDSLFPGGVGKTANDDDFRSLLGDVEREIFDAFGDDTRVHPGHGDSTTLGAERPQLDEWRARGW